jgi:spore cortex formation protein SpoVR/YcgB (stage V sporulation)
MGLPNRFIHWYWGGTYKELGTQQNKEVFSILELNTVPSRAFLRSRNIRNEAERHARLIRSYERQHGRDRIEKLLDAIPTVATSVSTLSGTPRRSGSG